MHALNAVHLNGLRAVEAVARLGGLQAAAEELGVSPSAVSQQINRAEKQLGRALFARGPRGMAPTPFGAAVCARLTAGFRELAAAVVAARRDDEGPLLVSVAPAFASRWLIARLARLFKRHPDILVRIDASARIADLEGSDIDVAIRFGDGRWPGVEARLLVAQEIYPVAAPSIARQIGSLEDLSRATVIIDEGAIFSWEAWFAAFGRGRVPLQSGARFSDPLLCLDAAIGGNGVMLAWDLIAGDAVADGRLVAPFGKGTLTGLGYWLCTRRGAAPRKVRAFTSWIVEEIRRPREAYPDGAHRS